jgi:hypothetical protein
MLGRQLSRTGTLGPITTLGEHDRPDIVLDDDGDRLGPRRGHIQIAGRWRGATPLAIAR